MTPRWLMLVATLGIAACGDDLTAPDVVARVATDEIKLATFESYLEQSSIQLDAGARAPVLTQLFDEFLDERLLLLMAIDEGLASESAGSLEAMEALVEASLQEDLSDERVLLHYRQHVDRFDRPERVRLSQILVEELPDAEAALAELNGGSAFEEVARRVSLEPAAAVGGDQGYLGREDLPPAFVETIFELEEGAFSEIVRADYGYHIFRVTERRAAESVPLVDVAGEIRDELRNADAQQTRERLVGEARARYNTKVYASNLPFDYQGVHSSG